VKRVLGVECRDDALNLVDIEEKGILKRKFRILSHDRLDLPENLSPDEKIDVIQTFLGKRKKCPKNLSIGISTRGVKTAIVSIPEGVQDPYEWITEHLQAILKLPISAHELVIGYEKISNNIKGDEYEVTLIRKTEISEWLMCFDGWKVLSIGVGARESLNPFLHLSNSSNNTDCILIQNSPRSVTGTLIKNGIRINVVTGGDREAVLTGLGGVGNRNIYEIGRGGNDPDENSLMPFHLPNEFISAYGCGIKALVPEFSPADFRPPDVKTKVDLALSKSLFQRTVFTLGGLVLILLLGVNSAQMFLESRTQQSEASLQKSGLILNQITTLERKIADLRNRLGGDASTLKSSNVSRIVHDLAGSTPDSLWFRDLKIGQSERGKYSISIGGVARNSETVARYLKNLSLNNTFEEIQLVKAGKENQVQQVSTVTRSFNEFEIRLKSQ
jgi:Tfp pilus assembly protein PilN